MLYNLHRHCAERNVACDTTRKNAQESEHYNKVLKHQRKKQSSHVHVVGPKRSLDEHKKSCMLTAFTHERIAKRIGYRIGRVTPATEKQRAKASRLRILADESEFQLNSARLFE